MPLGPQPPSVYPSQQPKVVGPLPPLGPRERPYKAIVVIIVAIGIVAALVVAYYPKPYPINITSIDLTSTYDVCGSNGLSFGGISGPLSTTFSFGYAVQNERNNRTCTISKVSAETSGFIASAPNLPFTVPPYSVGDISLNVTAPSHPFTGVLRIDLE
jgi:hypothetical protein